MKKIIGFVVGTAVVIALATGVQANTSGHEEDKQPTSISSTPSTGSAKPDDGQREGFTEDQGGKPGEDKSQSSAAPTTVPASPSAPTGNDSNDDDGQRAGFTEDHQGKPGENK